MPKNEKVSIIMPVYNEKDKIENTLKSYYKEIIKKLPNSEFIIADDGSTDGTKEILMKLRKIIPMKLILSPKNHGYFYVVKNTLLLAKGDVVFFSDSDGQYNPKDFWKLYEKIKNYDLVVGIRTKRVDPFIRKILTKFYNMLNWIYFGVYLNDTNSGFKMMKREVVEKIVRNVKYIKYGFSTELIVRAFYKRLKIAAVPITHFPRDTGLSTQFIFKKIPRVVKEQILGMNALKSELKNSEFPENKIDIFSEDQ